MFVARALKPFNPGPAFSLTRAGQVLRQGIAPRRFYIELVAIVARIPANVIPQKRYGPERAMGCESGMRKRHAKAAALVPGGKRQQRNVASLLDGTR